MRAEIAVAVSHVYGDTESIVHDGARITAHVADKGEALAPETRTRASLHSLRWDETLRLGVRVHHLQPSASLNLTLWHSQDDGSLKPAGSASLRLFSHHFRLKRGKQRLPLHRHDHAHPQMEPSNQAHTELRRLEKAQKRFTRGDLRSVPWLDQLTSHQLHLEEQREEDRVRRSGSIELLVHLPIFDLPVAFSELSPLELHPPNPATASSSPKKQQQSHQKQQVHRTDMAIEFGNNRSLMWINDPEVGKENPSERKARKLARSVSRSVVDRDVKPDGTERAQLQAALRLPPTRALSQEQKELVWKFRFTLQSEPTALPKFLRSVDWDDARETKQALELLDGWAPIAPSAALELLSPDFRSEHVRRVGVDCVNKASDDELLSYLLQLVQALRYEPRDDSKLSEFLAQRASKTLELANFLQWFLVVESEDGSFAPRAMRTQQLLEQEIGTQPEGNVISDVLRRQWELIAQLCTTMRSLDNSKGYAKKTERLRQLLSRDGLMSELRQFQKPLPLPLNPNVRADGVIAEQSSCFKSSLHPLQLAFEPHVEHPSSATIELPASEPDDAYATSQADHPPSSSYDQSIYEKACGEKEHGLSSDEEQVHQQQSSQEVANLQENNSPPYVVIFKRGDDLRQDQLCVQLIQLMDRLLKRENLDLKLTVYSVLASSSDHGMVEFVQGSVNLSNILSEHKSVSRYLALHNPDPEGPLGMSRNAFKTFVKSCAGYCVITYLLGVGDRHLDNLMVREDGRFFHIDFGYIMGHEPKPFAPPVKLNKEMVEVMGGVDSDAYVEFQTYCCEAYNILRKSAPLLLNLVSLMAESNIPDIAASPEKVLLKLESKFRLDLDDESAGEHLKALMTESVNAIFPKVIETAHRVAQYWR